MYPPVVCRYQAALATWPLPRGRYQRHPGVVPPPDCRYQPAPGTCSPTSAQVSATSAHMADACAQIPTRARNMSHDMCAGISRLGASADDVWPDGTASRAASRLPRLFANRWERCPYCLQVKNRPACQQAGFAIAIGASSALETVPSKRTNVPTSARDAAGRTGSPGRSHVWRSCGVPFDGNL